MSLSHAIHQQFILPLFVATNNAGEPLSKSDANATSDVKSRAQRNAGSHKKEPADVAGPRWVEQHLQVYAEFCRLAHHYIAQGWKQYGAKSIAEEMRRHSNVQGGRDYKIANFAVTYMAVKFAKENPDYAEFFKINKKV